MFALTTQRLFIREILESDAQDMLNAMACPEIHSMHSNEFTDIDRVKSYIALLTTEYQTGKYRTLGIALRESDRLIGQITIDRDRFFARAELGYWIAKPYRNQGYATEAVRCVILYGLRDLSLQRVQATRSPNNPASGRVLEKAGMRYEGTLRRYRSFGEISRDSMMYSAIKPDFPDETF